MSNIIERIKMLADNEKLSIRQLEKVIGASNGVISNALKKNTDIQGKWLSKIIYNFPIYNSEWLLTGSGDMCVGYTKNLIKEPEIPITAKRSKEKDTEETKDYRDVTIETLQKLVERQDELITRLKNELNELTNECEQKRKAG